MRSAGIRDVAHRIASHRMAWRLRDARRRHP
jgi:hypothetical protein